MLFASHFNLRTLNELRGQVLISGNRENGDSEDDFHGGLQKKGDLDP
jgi:hypothetical protein